MYRILIVEDNDDIARLVQLHVEDMHVHADIAGDGRRALELIDEHDYDLVVLDLMLPEVDGLEVCKQLRARPGYTPVIMLTSKSSELDRVLGLEIGADDYVTKPFSIPELMARIKAQLRRNRMQTAEPGDSGQVLSFGKLKVDIDKRQVFSDDAEITLTAREFDLLTHFLRHPGHVYNRNQLLEQVWGYGYEGYEHTVNSHINRLRAKIEQDPAHPEYILTVWGVGYRCSEKPPHAAHAL